MHAPVAYIIWYGNWTGNTGVGLLINFVTNIGASPWWSIVTRYNNASSMTYGGSANDSYSQGRNLTQTTVFAIVTRAINSHVLPNNTNGLYLVLSSADVFETGFCTADCGWHSYDPPSQLKFGWIGDPTTQCPNACSGQHIPPNGNFGADAMASVIAHEAAEAATDPFLNAWLDSNGDENGDKCAWTFGNMTRLSSGAYYNIVVGGTNYLIQQMWRVPNQDCGMS